MGRYTRISKYRHPRDKKVVRLFGENEDRNRWYKCWNCNFYIDSKRTSATGRGDGINYDPVEGPLILEPALTGDARSVTIVVGGDIVMFQENADGTNKSIYIYYTSESGDGCPLCGTRNWR